MPPKRDRMLGLLLKSHVLFGRDLSKRLNNLLSEFIQHLKPAEIHMPQPKPRPGPKHAGMHTRRHRQSCENDMHGVRCNVCSEAVLIFQAGEAHQIWPNIMSLAAIFFAVPTRWTRRSEA